MERHAEQEGCVDGLASRGVCLGRIFISARLGCVYVCVISHVRRICTALAHHIVRNEQNERGGVKWVEVPPRHVTMGIWDGCVEDDVQLLCVYMHTIIIRSSLTN